MIHNLFKYLKFSFTMEHFMPFYVNTKFGWRKKADKSMVCVMKDSYNIIKWQVIQMEVQICEKLSHDNM